MKQQMRYVLLLKAQCHWGKGTTKGGRGAKAAFKDYCPRRGQSPSMDMEPKLIVTLTMSAWPQQPTHIIQNEDETEAKQKDSAENMRAKRRTLMLTQECALATIECLDCCLTTKK